MKRWLAFFMALLLCCGTALAEATEDSGERAGAVEAVEAQTPADEPVPEPTFTDSLREWAVKLDPQTCDLTGAVSIGESAWTALIQRDAGATSIAVDGLGTLQLTGEDIALRVGEETYVLDLQPLLSAMKKPGLDEAELEADLQALEGLLQRAVQELLLPFVDWKESSDGVAVHVAINGQDLAERLYDYIDGTLGDAAFDRLYTRFGSALRALVPDLPDSAQELRAQWGFVKPYIGRWFYGFSFDADAQLTDWVWGERGFACTGNFSNRRGQTDFSLEYTADHDGFSVAAGLGDGGRGSLGAVSVFLDGHGDQLDGTLLVENYTTTCCQLNATFLENGINAVLTLRQDGALVWTSTLYGCVDVSARTVSATLDYTDYDYGDPETRTVAQLEVHYWDQGYTGFLTLPGESIHFHGVTSSGFTHHVVKLLPASYYDPSQTVDFWLFSQGRGGYRARCDIAGSRSGRQVFHTRLSCEVNENGASFEVSDPLRGTSTSGSVRFISRDDGFDFDLEFLDDAQRYYARYMTKKLPFGIHVSRNGGEYTVSLTGTDADDEQTDISARFGLDDSGSIAWLEGEASTIYPQREEPVHRLSVSYKPEKTVVTSDGETVTIERISESARAVAYQLRYMNADPVTVELSLDEALRVLEGRIIVEGYTIGEARIAAADRTDIVPIDRENAIPVDLDLIMSLVSDLMASPQPDYGAAVVEVPAEDAVEEAAEAMAG